MDSMIEQIREEYKSIFGKYPSPNAKTETLLNRLKQEGVDISKFEPEPETPTAEEDFSETTETPSETTETPSETTETPSETTETPSESENLPVSKGRGVSKRYLVFFRGQARYWTHASIQSMKSMSKQIKFPSNTDYDEAANFHKCKTC